jgi:hypothetical protein
MKAMAKKVNIAVTYLQPIQLFEGMAGAYPFEEPGADVIKLFGP